MKKDELIERYNRMIEVVSKLEKHEVRLRKEFSYLLRCGHHNPAMYSTDEKSASWEEIFFRIGELNSDANYSILVEERQRLLVELADLRDLREKEKKDD